MIRTILLFCCGLLVLNNDALATSLAALEQPVMQPASRAQAVKPLVIPARKAPAKASTKVPAKPAVKAAHAAQSSASAKTAKAVKASPVKAKPSRSNAARTKLAPVKLNLNLPPELVENMDFGKPLAEVDELPVLPPMFGASKPAPSAYQLSGKLISNERQKETSDNYLDSVEGAELSIEFRH